MAMTLANKVTLGRIIIVPLFISIVLYYSPHRDYLRYYALVFFLIAVISDVVDGYIARRYYQKTKAGAILDPLADKLLLISSFICLYKVGVSFPDLRFPIWFVVTLISRDVILLLGALIIQLTTGRLNVQANRYGKFTAFLQTMCVIGMLAQWSISEILWPVTVAMTVISGIIYMVEGMRILNESPG